MTQAHTDSAPSEAPRVRTQRTSCGLEGDALVAEVRGALDTLTALLQHRSLLGAAVIEGIEATLAEVGRRLAREGLSVVVVGEEQSGKSTFLNAILGDRLLGTARRERSTVTFLRRAAEPGYRARMNSGAVEEFARKVPDTRAELAQRVEEAKQALAEAEAARTGAEATAGTAAEALARADADLKQAFASFEAARGEAARIGEELQQAEIAAASAEKAAAERGQAVPSPLRETPPWWAFWLWIALGLFAMVRWSVWRAYAAEVRALRDARAAVARLRPAGSGAAEACRLAEAALAPHAAAAEHLREELVAAKRAVRDATGERDEARERVDSREKELDRQGADRRRRFFSEVAALSDLGSRGKDVAELVIDYPARLLPDDVTIVDTPSVTQASASMREDAWRVIRDEADGCILVSELERAVSEPTKRFLQQVREVVPHVLLVLTKLDEAVTKALRKGEREPWQHIERARRIGTRRFAREVGRDPSNVLSIAVAAEVALQRDRETHGLARRFEADMAKLFQLLRHERALILGARSAAVVRRCISAISATEGAAERLYDDRIATLEAKRIPAPEAFTSNQLRALAPASEQAAREVVASAVEHLGAGVRLVALGAADRIRACGSKEELRALFPVLERDLGDGLANARHEALLHLQAGAARAARELEAGPLAELQRLYRIAHTVTRASSPFARLEHVAGASPPAVAVVPRMEGAIVLFGRVKIGLGVGGAAVGALIGTAIVPGLGTAAGAAVGALATFVRGLSALRRSCTGQVDLAVGAALHDLTEELRAMEASVLRRMRESLERSLEQAVVRYGQWIVEPIEAERVEIERERGMLDDLRARRMALTQHDEHLAVLIASATEASVGLCK